MKFWVFWLFVVIILSIIEATTVNLISIWFIIGALISLIVSIFIDNFVLQFYLFAIIGIILLILTKPIINKCLIVNRKEKTNLDRVVGMTGLVTFDIKKNVIGEVKIDGKRWSAISKDEIDSGSVVVVEKIDGVKLVVRKEGE